MAQVTIFGAGAMGTALAMHAARKGLEPALWANQYDGRALESIRTENRHPALPDELVEPVPAGDGGADGEFLGHFGARRGGSLLGDRLRLHDGRFGAARRALRTVEAWQIAQIGEPRE